MKLGIIGAGNVGGTLGKLWAARGHDILFGVRAPQDPNLRGLLDTIGSKGRAGSVREAASFGEAVVLATPWPAAHDAIQAAGDLAGKILVDCTNPLAPDLSGLVLGHTTSAAEEIAKWAPKARVVKAFNTTGAGNFGRAQNISMFICGDDPEAKSVVGRLAAELGFDVIDAGALKSARLLEPLAMLWIHLAYAQKMGPDIAFKLLRKNGGRAQFPG